MGDLGSATLGSVCGVRGEVATLWWGHGESRGPRERLAQGEKFIL